MTDQEYLKLIGSESYMVPKRCNKKEPVGLSKTIECCYLCREELTYCYQCGRSFHDSSLTRINDGEPTCIKCLNNMEISI